MNDAESIPLSEFTRVSVLWRETGCRFPATIVSIEKDETYEVLYDEFVRNKPCFEKHVNVDRLSLLFEEEASEVTKSKESVVLEKIDTPIFTDPNSIPSPEKSDIFSDIEKIMDTFDSDSEHNVIFNQADLIQLHIKLTPQKIQELIVESPAMLHVMNIILCNMLMSAINNKECKSIFDAWEEYASSANVNTIVSKAVAWLHPSGFGGKMCHSIKLILITAEIALRAQTTFQLETDKHNINVPASRVDDTIKLAVNVCSEILKKNLFSKVIEEPVDKTSKSSKQSVSKHILVETTKTILPVMDSIISHISVLVSSQQRPELVIGLLTDLCLLVMKLDRTFASVALDATTQATMHSVQKNSIHILSFVFKQYQSCRVRLLLEMIPLFLEIYNLKQTPTSYSLLSDMSFQGSSGVHKITMLCSLLLRLFQSIMTTHTMDDSLSNRPDEYQYFQDPESFIDHQYEGKTSESQIRLWKLAFGDCCKYCNMFIGELLKRCNHKEFSGEYRILLSKLIEELLLALRYPIFCVVGLIFEQFLGKIQSEILKLGGIPKQANSLDHSTKRDTTFINFLIDQLANIGKNFRLMIIPFEKANINDINFIDSDTSKALTFKLQMIRKHWDPYIDNTNRKKTSPGGSQYGLQLKILSDILNSYFSAIAEVPLANRIVLSVPSTDYIIEHFSSREVWSRLLSSETSQLDVEGFTIIEYLQTLHEQLNKSSLTRLAVKDAICLLLLLWLRVSTIMKNRICMQYIENLFLNFVMNGEDSHLPSAPLPRFKLLFPINNNHDSSHKTVPRQLALLNADERFNTNNNFWGLSENVVLIFNDLINRLCIKNVFESTVEMLTHSLTDPSPLVRSRSIRSLNTFIKVDKDLFMSRESLKTVLTERLQDIAISVREEAVKLIGYFISTPDADLNDPQIIGYLNALRLNLYDPGISVRKAAVQIFRDILISPRYLDSIFYVDICTTLLERWQYPKEEESLKESIMELFRSIWFTPSQSTESTSFDLNCTPGSVYGIVNKDISEMKSSRSSQKPTVTINKCLRLLDVALSLKNIDWFTLLIRNALFLNEMDDANTQIRLKREASIEYSNNIIELLFEILLKCEDENPELLTYLESRKRSNGELVVGIFLLLSAFGEAYPQFLLRRMTLLIPYLKVGKSLLTSEQESILFDRICEMISIVSTLEESSINIGHFAREIVDDLIVIILKSSASNIHSGVKAVCVVIARVLHDPTPLIALIDKCFISITVIAKTLSQEGLTTPTDPQIKRIQRCLPILGAVCANINQCQNLLALFSNRNSELDDMKCAEKFVGDFERIIVTAIHGCCYSAVSYAISLDEASIQSHAVQALCSIFLGCPKLILLPASTTLLRKILASNHFADKVKEKLFTSLKVILDLEEARLLQNSSLQAYKETATEIQGEKVLLPQHQEGDTTVAGFVLQQHLSSLQSYLCHQNVSIRRSSLSLIGTMLRQGMLCPLDIICHLIGLQCDYDQIVRQESLRILQLEDQRHPSYVDNRIVEGIELGYILQVKLIGEQITTCNALDQKAVTIDNTSMGNLISESSGISIFGNVYMTCLQSNRKRRTDMMIGLLRRSLQIVQFLHELTSNNAFPSKISNSHLNMPSSSSSSSVGPGASLLPIISIVQSFISNGLLPNDRIFYSNKIAWSIDNCKVILSASNLLIGLCNFMISSLACLPLEYLDEALQCIYWINRNVSIATGNIMQTTRENLESLGAMDTNDSNHQSKDQRIESRNPWDSLLEVNEEYAANIHHGYLASRDPYTKWTICHAVIRAHISRGLESFLRLKAFYKSNYDISDDVCLQFRPNDKFTSDLAVDNMKLSSCTDHVYDSCDSQLSNQQRKADMGKRRGQKEKNRSPESPSSNQNVERYMCILTGVTEDYNRVYHMFEHGVDDFQVVVSKRKRKSGLSVETGTKTDKLTPSTKKLKKIPLSKSSLKKTVRKKRSLLLHDDSDEDYDDEDQYDD